MQKRIIIGYVLAVVLGGLATSQHHEILRLQSARESADQNMLVFVVERQILATNRRLSLSDSRTIAIAGLECAKMYNLDPMLLFATMRQESNFNPRAVGAAGERGLMQITETTAVDLGLQWRDAFDVIANTCAGASYLARHVHERGVHDGLLRYNGGGEPSYPRLVMAHYQDWSAH
jgi:soluble lytic murein transglycosylase-like protein